MNQKFVTLLSIILCFGSNLAKPALAQTVEKQASEIFLAKQSKLDKVLSSDTIGKNYRKLGNLLGKPINVEDGLRTYVIDNCNVTLKTFKNKGKTNKMYDGIIEAVELELTPKCTFDLTSIFPSLAPQKTANEILAKDLPADAEFYSNCLMECDNLSLGRNEIRYGLKQQDEYLFVNFIFDFDTNFMAKTSAETLRDEIKAKNPNAKSEEVNCDPVLNNWAKSSLGNFTFGKIRFGMEDMNRDAMPFCKVGE